MIPQIIWIVLAIAGLMLESYRHGKDKTGKYSVWSHLVAIGFTVMLLYYGGFFDPILTKFDF
jgi:hypothetical protein